MKLVTIKMPLELPEKKEFSFQKASLMQGVLMEWLDSDYVQKLHSGGWNPYAQHIERINGEWIWSVSLFGEEVYQQMYPVLTNPELTSFQLKHDNIEIFIKEKRVEETDSDELMNQFYFQDASKYIKIRFLTPTAFKRNGQYVFHPDIACILQSMIHKYDAVTTCTGEIDDRILQELVKNTRITQYDLRSCSFHLEGVKIPAFIGEVTFGLRGSQTLINYIHFLFRFACYSGIGIKTAIGMGAIEIQEKRK